MNESNPITQPKPVLEWTNDDWENRIGWFQAGRFTTVNKLFSLLLALFLTGIFFTLLYFLHYEIPSLAPFLVPLIRSTNLFSTLPAMLFFFWAVTILLLKHQKLSLQTQALSLAVLPNNPEFCLTPSSAPLILQRITALVDLPRQFLLLNRIESALSHLHQLSGVNDVVAILKNQSDHDENLISSSYQLLHGMVWAIPVLGFIGTVKGLSVAIGQFGNTLQSVTNPSDLTQSLTGVTNGLATAFETTLVALVAALIIQLLINLSLQKEMDFLDNCNDYCQQNLVQRLQLSSPASPAITAPTPSLTNPF